MTKVKAALAATLALAAFCTPLTMAQAQDSYPTKPIRLIIPFPPGGFNDVVARHVANGLSERLGQPVVAENRAGANGNIAGDYVAKSPPDGYVITAVNLSILAINPALYARMNFDVLKDLAPVAGTAQVNNVLVVNKNLPVNNLAELIAYAKQNPGKLTFASSGNGTSPHISGELLKQKAGIEAVHIPYKSAGAAQTDVLAGRVSMQFGNIPNLISAIESGDFKPIAVTGAERSKLLPNVPTFKEAGLDMTMSVWFGISAPAGTPKPIIDKLNREINAVLESKATANLLDPLDATAWITTPEEFGAFIVDQKNLWQPVIKASGATID
ncbi:tripartite tricarboxylate transporter substrate binding protein [Ancylobacter sp. A5.8]|uniref:Bug family tripartite tricarboxylate transporter substrate binding protein n=1 Tax=Ancylobacter gelatini TaxID=2919920 RepID=UPI001F4DD3D8|nr:tripartite tricarboxylate transporter substrate binding protein [Ancylobacter gelatini]MCJ8144033.1 tripartite tricarboxylate transporter substrate binding protein [Ancylobacter gelatini]